MRADKTQLSSLLHASTDSNLWLACLVSSPFYTVERYFATIERYRDVVASELFGHVHSNELRVVDSLPDDAAPMLILGSIAPGYTTNPFFDVVLYDRGETKRPRDLVTYQVDLAVHNGTAKSDPDPDIWDRMFASLTSHLGMKALTNAETRLLGERMFADDTTFDAYFNYWYKGLDQPGCGTDGDCRRKEACLLPCGSVNETWQACLVGDESVCSLEAAGVTSGASSSAPPSLRRRQF